ADVARTDLAFVERRITEAIADVFERGITGIARYREHRFERRMQSTVDAMAAGHAFLQEFAIRISLDREQRRHVENDGTLAKVFADALLFGERITHGEYHLGVARPPHNRQSGGRIVNGQP